MSKRIKTVLNSVLLLLMTPFMFGFIPALPPMEIRSLFVGASSIGLLSSLFSFGGSGGGTQGFLEFFLGGGGGSSDGSSFSGSYALAIVGDGSTIASISNPEPATMLLMGGGMVALNYFKNKIKK